MHPVGLYWVNEMDITEYIGRLWRANMHRILDIKSRILAKKKPTTNLDYDTYKEKTLVALITGGSGGLGLEIAIALVQRYKSVIVAIVDVVPPKKQLVKQYPNIIHYRCDITDSFQVAHMKKKVLLDFGKVNILVNNAAITIIKQLTDMTEAEIQRVINVNLIASYHLVSMFVPEMLYTKNGCIINIASVLGELTPSRLIVYGATKGGLIELHNYLNQQINAHNSYAYNRRGLKAILVCPGKISTTMFKDVDTPSKFLAPDLPPNELATEIIKTVDSKISSTLRRPYYSGLIPYIKILNQSYLDLLKNLSGMNRVTKLKKKML